MNHLVAIESLEANVSLNREVLESWPQYKTLIPLAAKKEEQDLALLATGLFPKSQLEVSQSSTSNTSGIKFEWHWWGVAINVNHDKLHQFMNVPNSTAFSAALASILTGPNAVAISALTMAIKLYSNMIRVMEKGNGIRFNVPWIAIYPIPTPVYIIPYPL